MANFPLNKKEKNTIYLFFYKHILTAVPILEGNHKKLLWFSNSHNLFLKAHATGLKPEMDANMLKVQGALPAM